MLPRLLDGPRRRCRVEGAGLLLERIRLRGVSLPANEDRAEGQRHRIRPGLPFRQLIQGAGHIIRVSDFICSNVNPRNALMLGGLHFRGAAKCFRRLVRPAQSLSETP